MTLIKITLTTYVLTFILFTSCLNKGDSSKSGKQSNDSVNRQQSDTSLNGLYVGLEEMCWTDSAGKKECYNDPADPKWKWYHQGFLRIKGDSVFLDQNPIYIYKTDTMYSASDGAFYYYSGTLQKSDTTVIFNLIELFCDYCAEPILKPGETKEVIKKQLKGLLTDKGFLIDGNLYARKIEDESLISEHLETLQELK